MRVTRLLSLVSLALGLLALAAASAPVTSADAEANRRLLHEIRTSDPEHFARLRDSFDRFQAMTPQRRDQLRQLDRELHQLDPQKQAHLTHVLGEYAAWITRLPPA